MGGALKLLVWRLTACPISNVAPVYNLLKNYVSETDRWHFRDYGHLFQSIINTHIQQLYSSDLFKLESLPIK